MAKAAAGEPNRFITLTVNPRVGDDPDDRLAKLANAWRNTAKRIKRQWPKKPFAYLAIVEATKAGEPHLHILWRGPFIPQRWLSETMGELLESPIVDIRQIRNQREVIRYVAKYVTKAPHHFGTCKRYWSSQNWELDSDRIDSQAARAPGPWAIERVNISTLLRDWSYEGYAMRSDGGDAVYGVLIGVNPWPGWEKPDAKTNLPTATVLDDD